MSFKLLTIPALFLLVAVGCSRNPEAGSTASVTAPTPVATADIGSGGVSRGMIVNFPPRADGVDFRAQLENKYVSMGRRPAQVYVDPDGEATWVGEYVRYRVNGCDHETATQRSLVQIEGGTPPPVCSALIFPETAIYPPRDQVVDFRRQLGAKYQAMGRSAQSAVDPDGAAIWLSEYYRYRTSGCDHANSVQNVLVQVDGQAAPPSCLQSCAYNLDTPATVPGTGGNFSVQLVRTSGTCEWIAGSQSDWIIVSRPITGGDRGTLTYNVLPNNGSARSGSIKIAYPGGASYLTVNQGSPSYNLNFQLFDPATSQSTPTNECKIRGTATICTLTAVTSALPAGVATYDWRVEYTYNGSKVKTQVGPLSSFSFTESCGPAPPEGAVIPIVATLTAADGIGNSGTAVSGQGSQQALQLRIFSCP